MFCSDKPTTVTYRFDFTRLILMQLFSVEKLEQRWLKAVLFFLFMTRLYRSNSFILYCLTPFHSLVFYLLHNVLLRFEIYVLSILASSSIAGPK